MAEIDWQFHMRNFNANYKHVRVHHDGCGKTPWHDHRPACWEENLPYCPGGLPSGQAVYVPSNWVIQFGDWWQLIKDGLKLIAHMGILLYPPVTEQELVEVCMDIFQVEKDIVQALVDDMSQEELDAMLQTAHESLEHTCTSNGIPLDLVQNLAEQMGLSNWAFIAGRDYRANIHDDDSPIVGNKGWSVFQGNGQNYNDNLKIATSVFIEKGHLIYPFGMEESIDNLFWTHNF